MSVNISLKQRQAMIDCQLRPNQVTNPRIVDAFSRVDRSLYVPQSLTSVAYSDNELEIAPARYIMEPRVFGRMLQEADLSAEDMALVLSCGTGYAIAVLYEIVASVAGVESDKALYQKAAQLLGRSAVVFDSVSPASAFGPFSFVLVDGAVEDVGLVQEQALQAGLADQARILLVERKKDQPKGRALRLDWRNNGWTSRVLFDASSALLPHYSKPEVFTF